jgi:hypothetical protein
MAGQASGIRGRILSDGRFQLGAKETMNHTHATLLVTVSLLACVGLFAWLSRD